MMRIVVAGSILGLVCLAGVARGQSYGEQTAATGIHSTLASSGGNSARSVLDTVNRNLPKVSTPDFEKPFSGHSGGGKAKSGGGGAGGKGSWASGGSGSSSKSPAGKGWATASSSTGRGAAGGKSAWESTKSSGGKGEGWASATDKTHPATRRR